MSVRLAHASVAWFDMVGRLMSEAARPLLPHVSLVERFTDGVELEHGLVQGLRFEATLR